MKKIIIATLLVAFTTSAALAADVVVLKAKNGDVTFNHKAHVESLKDCKLCHGDTVPAKIELDKATAHALCKGCHTTKAQGPTKCGECHKKA